MKKTFSLLISIFIVLSNFAFAQLAASSAASGAGGSGGSGQYEGMPIDDSREGIDFRREGDIIVYPARINSEEMDMAERFAKGEISKEEAIKMAKAKFGSSFSEEGFQQDMAVSRERMSRKEAFSYENEGYAQMYNAGPSYEGYSREHMIFAKVFEYIGDDIDPREIKQSCENPEKIADSVIKKFKEKTGDVQKICSTIEDEEAKCSEYAKKACHQMGTASVREGASEMEKINSIAYSCPANKNAIIEACKKRNTLYMEQRIKNSGEECEKRFNFEGERLVQQCENFKQSNICDKDRFMDRCMAGVKKDDSNENIKGGQGAGFMQARWECYDGASETHTDGSCKDSESWNNLARKSCEGRCYPDKSKCGVNTISVSSECSSVPKPGPCPAYPVPQCGEREKLETKTDSNGCAYYNCVPVESQCPQQVIPQCAERHTLQKKIDDRGCVSYYCQPPETVSCPESRVPECAAGTELQKKLDEKGCVFYYCETAQTDTTAPPVCKEVQKPACAAGETINAYYDTAGCVTSYQCVMQQSSCPEVSKPSCSEGQSLSAKYDDKRCIVGYECISMSAGGEPSPSSITGNAIMANSIKVTGKVTLNAYDDFLRQCENSWMQQQRICSDNSNACDKNAFIEKCKEQEKRNYYDFISRMEQNCESQTASEVIASEQRCARMDGERQRCLEQSEKRCTQMKGNAEQCKSILTEESLRKFIADETRKRCRFTDIMQDENEVKESGKAEIILAVLNTATESDFDKLRLFVDGLQEDLKLKDTTVYKGTISPSSFGDIKLLPFVVNAKLSAAPSSERAKEAKEEIVAGRKAEEAAGRLVSLRDSDLPKEYLYIIEDKASDVLDVSDSLESIEKNEGQKGFGYKIKLFFGLAKQAEKEEINQLEESKSKLIGSIEALAKLADEVPGDVAKSILKEQVESLKGQQQDIEVLIETKERKAKGLFGVFG